jgi:hypothetical protein
MDLSELSHVGRHTGRSTVSRRVGEQRNGAVRRMGVMHDQTTAEARMYSTFINRLFVPTPGKPFSAWLLYDTKTGQGLALAVGSFKPTWKLRRGEMKLGAAAVDKKFQPVLLLHGPEALRVKDGKVVLHGQ